MMMLLLLLYQELIFLDNSFGSKSKYSFLGNFPAVTFNCCNVLIIVVLLQSESGYTKVYLVFLLTMINANFTPPGATVLPYAISMCVASKNEQVLELETYCVYFW